MLSKCDISESYLENIFSRPPGTGVSGVVTAFSVGAVPETHDHVCSAREQTESSLVEHAREQGKELPGHNQRMARERSMSDGNYDTPPGFVFDTTNVSNRKCLHVLPRQVYGAMGWLAWGHRVMSRSCLTAIQQRPQELIRLAAGRAIALC